MRGESSRLLRFLLARPVLIRISPVAHFCLNKVSIPNKLNLREFMMLRTCRLISMPRE